MVRIVSMTAQRDTAQIDPPDGIRCARCNAPSKVRLSNMSETVFLCLDCYDRQCDAGLIPSSGGRSFDGVRLRVQIASAMVVVGTVVAAATAAADFVQLGDSEGFGWKQALTLVIGLLLMGSGALFHIGVLGGVGAVCVIMAVFADWFARVGELGSALQSTVGVVVAAVLIGTGTFVARTVIISPESQDSDPTHDGTPQISSLQSGAH